MHRIERGTVEFGQAFEHFLIEEVRAYLSYSEKHLPLELRVFGGLTIPETAEMLVVSHATVERDWYTVRAWLRRELARSG